MRATRIGDWRGNAGDRRRARGDIGCVTPADFEKVRRDVMDLKRGGAGAAGRRSASPTWARVWTRSRRASSSSRDASR